MSRQHDKIVSIQFKQVLGHSNIEGNEKADQEAKKTAESTDTLKLNITSFADKKKNEIKWHIH